MSPPANRPALPLIAREYATIERNAIPEFPEEISRRRWGCLHSDDQNGEHWTILGDYEYVIALQQVPQTSSAQMDDFPPDEFRPQWFLQGWPDEWLALDGDDERPLIALKLTDD